MQAYHDTREEKFKKPFGAVLIDTNISLSIDLWEEDASSCSLRIWTEDEGERIIDMERNVREGGLTFCTSFTPTEPALYWYCFIITKADGGICYYGAKNGRTNGIGQMYDYLPPSFQITVSKERKLPKWYENAICYQIFPDRFYRSEKYIENQKEAIKLHTNGPIRELVDDWNKAPEYEKDNDGRITKWDFYGGNLDGIIEKLDYLEDLGITAIYLNPVFEAASNHRYDTGDYKMIDPLLGDEEKFKELCAKAKKHGISIILDGVFNHTGCDSLYFNKYGNYDSLGAFESESSPYRSWYSFDESKAGYDCWWGVDDLPNINEGDENYKNYIYKDEDSVVRHWLRAGAKGFRLDVADELPDEFIAGIKKTILEEKPEDGLLMGEVWEDASNKMSYGKVRKYFLGDELDCTMNYPFRDGVLNFLTGKISALELNDILTSLYENYPKEAFYGALNLLGSHDRPRVLSMLGEDDSSIKAKMWLAIVLQMTMPGVPCIYYGDEAGMTGMADPYNRGTYPWGLEDKDYRDMYRNAIGLRKIHPVFTKGDFKPVNYGDDVFGYIRTINDESVVVLVNRNQYNFTNVEIPLLGEKVTELISGRNLNIEDNKVLYNIAPMEAVVFYFHNKIMLGKPMPKGKGVLCHITSLPNNGKKGDIKDSAFEFLEFLKENKQTYWQILPLNPTDSYGSPYAGTSAFATNIDLTGQSFFELKTEYETIGDSKEFQLFCKENEEWLRPYAMYMALKQRNNNTCWQEWDKKYRDYDENLWEDEKLAKEAYVYQYCQYKFFCMWSKVRKRATEYGINIIGDMPMYVSYDSADVWANKEYFTLNSKGYPSMIAGVPPDYFAKEGQLWGNPLFDWEKLKQDNYKWWIDRLKRSFALYDYVRMDHFRGFESYYAVPENEKATKGKWKFGPGAELFEVAKKQLKELPVLAEDLGIITPAVRALVSKCGFLGMDIIQFYDGDPLAEYIPKRDKVVYSGTHDNETLVGWCEERYKDKEPLEAADELLEKIYETDADLIIIPLQDLQRLDNTARMNVPGTSKNNWSWQADSLKIVELKQEK